MYQVLVRPVVIYVCETWALKENTKLKLQVFERKVLRRIYGPTKENDGTWRINPLNAELNPIFHLLALLGGATIVVVSRLRVNELTNAKVLVVHSSHLLSTDAAARLCVRRAL